MKIDYSEIAVVIVTFRPSEEDLIAIDELKRTYRCIVEDNTFDNKGIAEAQNNAVKEALSDQNCRMIVFLDQDSRVEDSYPINIANFFAETREKENVGIVGPRLINSATGKPYPASDIIISSGSCVSRDVFEHIGFNKAKLFIDYVDFEWCWRAQNAGYTCVVASNLAITHTVGTRFFKMGRYVDIISKPERYYYQYRNYLWLNHIGYVPLSWKIRTGIKNTLRLFYVPSMTKNFCFCWKNILKGIADGFTKYKEIG